MISKKNLTIIITLTLLILLMIITPIQAATLGQVYNLKYETKGSTVYLSWSSVTNADGYDIYVNISNRGYKYIGSVTSAKVSIIGFQPNETYTAKVCAYKLNSSGVKEAGSFSEDITINFRESTTNLEKVTTLNVSQNNGLILLNWSKVPNATGYEVYADIPGSGYTSIGTVTGVNSAFVNGASNGKTYYFKVRAYKTLSSGELEYGEFSPEREIYFNNNWNDNDPAINTEENKIERVTNLYISSINENKVEIDWSRVNDAEAYEIYLAIENGSFYYVDTVYNNYATLKNLAYNTTYKIKVRAYKYVNGNLIYGEYSPERSFTTEKYTFNTQVTGLSISNIEQNKATISWNRVSGVDGYNIYLSTNNARNFKFVKSTTNISETLENLDYATTYYVKVSAYKYVNGQKIEGPASSYKQFTTKQRIDLPQVTHLSAEIKNRNEAYLYWWPVEGAAGYEIYLAKSGESFRKVVDTNESNAILYSNKLDYNTSYKVKVRAYTYTNGYLQYGKYSSYVTFKTEKRSETEGNERVPIVKNVKASVIGDTVFLNWDRVEGAVKYDVYFTVPGLGGVGNFVTTTNSKIISGLTDKKYEYTARVRAYKYVNGKLVAGPYSEISKFTGK